jgi:hypothetical protein
LAIFFRPETCGETRWIEKTPPLAGLLAKSLEMREITDWVVADAVGCEPVSLLFRLNRVIFYKKQGGV